VAFAFFVVNGFPMKTSDQIETCVDLIRDAKRIAALTGAGISTEAGIPDFRGPKGLYATMKVDPNLVFEIGHFRDEPGYFYRFAAAFIETLQTIQPTFSHRFLTRLEEDGRLLGIVTQNIDGLHQKAGSINVIELHGSFANSVCMNCGKTRMGLSLDWWAGAMAKGTIPPVADCSLCGGTIKPDVVFFGEPVTRMPEAEALVRSADLLLALGTSLTVYPAALLPQIARCPMIVVNQGRTGLDPAPDRIIVNMALDEFFNSIAESLGMQANASSEA
jgi:NAD-dependent deacetylase